MVSVAYLWPSDSPVEVDPNPTTDISNPLTSVRKTSPQHNPFAVTKDNFDYTDAVQVSTQGTSNRANSLAKPTIQYGQSCGEPCRDILDKIDFPFSLTDEEYEDGLGNTEALAEHLKLNPQLVQSWIDVASQAKGNKRSLILATFSLLDTEHQQAMGIALMDSPSYSHRMDAVRLLSSNTVMNHEHVSLFADRLLNEPNNYVRSALVKALNQPHSSLERKTLIASLEPVLDNDLDYTVRGEALLAIVDLHEHPQLALDQALAAVHSDVDVLQEYGARALQAIVTRQSIEGIILNSAQQYALRELKDNLTASQFDDMPFAARKLIDNL